MLGNININPNQSHGSAAIIEVNLSTGLHPPYGTVHAYHTKFCLIVGSRLQAIRDRELNVLVVIGEDELVEFVDVQGVVAGRHAHRILEIIGPEDLTGVDIPIIGTDFRRFHRHAKTFLAAGDFDVIGEIFFCRLQFHQCAFVIFHNPIQASVGRGDLFISFQRTIEEFQ